MKAAAKASCGLAAANVAIAPTPAAIEYAATNPAKNQHQRNNAHNEYKTGATAANNAKPYQTRSKLNAANAQTAAYKSTNAQSSSLTGITATPHKNHSQLPNKNTTTQSTK